MHKDVYLSSPLLAFWLKPKVSPLLCDKNSKHLREPEQLEQQWKYICKNLFQYETLQINRQLAY